jgi:hypothetical protein
LVDGRRVRRRFASTQEAQEELDKFRDETKNPKPVVVEPAPAPTLGQVFEKFLAQKSRKKTAHEFERVAAHLKQAFGLATPIPNIIAELISDYKATRRRYGAKASHSRPPPSTGRWGFCGASCGRR